ncbi:MAG: LacI family DNA-binding transcriptional regulator [Phocaeicola sp.]
MMKKNITIKDVARELNVAISTVSRAFNNGYDIHPDTKKRILSKAHEMGYHPNPFAKNLTQNKSNLIGVIVPEFINSYFPSIVWSIQEEALLRGYNLLILNSNEDAAKEMENIKILERNRVAGILIAFSHKTRDISYLQHLNKTMPIVQYVRTNKRLSTSMVSMNDYLFSKKITDHLIEQGYQHIYYVSGPDHLLISHNRKRGFIDSIEENGVSHFKKNIIAGGLYIEDGKELGYQILAMENKPDAIYCFNDLVAIGVMQSLQLHGVNVPGDIAVAGFTESKISEHLSPPLTTVAQPTVEIGKVVIDLLLKEINNIANDNPKELFIDGTLKIRGSVK